MALKARTVFRMVVAAAALGVLAYQHWHRTEVPAAPSTDVAPIATQTETRQPSQPPRTWQRGALTFKSCELSRPGSGARAQAWCTTFEVPENRDDPHSRRIGLKLAIARSEADAPEIDGVVRIAKAGKLRAGDWADVEITGADDYDLTARLATRGVP